MKMNFIRQVIRMSKLLFYGIFAQCLLMGMLMAKDGNGQSEKAKSIEEIFVKVKADSQKLLTVFDQIESQTDFTFSFHQQNVVGYAVQLEGKRQSLGDVLRSLSAQTTLKFTRVNANIGVSLPPKDATVVLVEEVAEPQQVRVSGKVTAAEDGEPLPGVSILVKGTSTGTTTDIDGNYALSAPEGSILQFSYIGFLTQEITVSNQTTLNIALASDLEQLEEVVVVGYGTTKKSDLTGSVASVKDDALTAFPVTDAVQALQGRAAGVQIQSTNGEPGSDFRVRVRGGTSINASSDPLFVVDGFVGGVLPAPEDIASVEVLKDASATAIYGSRGANGVILVTTKKGSAGKVSINYNGAYSVQNAVDKLDLLNANQFLALQNDIFPDANATSNGAETDWQDEVLRTGSIQNHNISFAGGTENANYFISGTLYDQQGIIDNSNFIRYSLTANLQSQLSDRFNLGLNIITRRSEQDGVETQPESGGSSGDGVTQSAYQYDPSLPVFNPDGTFTEQPPINNPVSITRGRIRETVRDEVQTALRGELKLMEGLNFISSLGIKRESQRRGTFLDAQLVTAGGTSDASISTLFSTEVLAENYFSYKKEIQDFNLDFTLGTSFQSFKDENISASTNNLATSSALFWDLAGGSLPGIPSSSLIESEILSYYSRFNINYDDRFLLTFTGRYDGASVFAEGEKWGFFPSAALGWNVINESFLKDRDFFSDLKLRASYGLTGNQAIRPYQTFATFETGIIFSSDLVNFENTFYPSTVANNSLKWETTSQLNVGLDMGIFGNRLELSFDYYSMTTDDLLFQRPLPAYSGFSFRTENIGESTNKGIELSLRSINIDKNDFKWSTDFNFSRNRNEITAIPVDTLAYATSPSSLGTGNNRALIKNQPIGLFWGYVYDGVYQEGEDFSGALGSEGLPGGQKFVDMNEDGVINDDDLTVIGDPNPDFIWGLNNTISYKGFDLNVFFQGVVGGDIMNLTRVRLENMNVEYNATTAVLNRWTPENTNTDVPVALAGRTNSLSTRFIEDGSYVKLRNIAIGYNFSQSVLDKLKLKKLRIYASGQNLLIITDYKGIDPEVSYSNSAVSTNLSTGLDFGSYPSARSFTVGLNLGF